MIEFFATIEPASLPLLAVLAFSVTLYPLGLMLGSECRGCCGCSSCSQGTLPDTVTVTLSNIPESGQGANLLSATLAGACFGSGASVVLDAPTGAVANAGPISAVTLVSGGSGYAKKGRTTPTVTATPPGNGQNANIGVTLTQRAGTCNLPYWEVTALTLNNGGTGYSPGYVVFGVANGDFVETVAEALVETQIEEPDVEVKPPSDGTGATFTTNLLELEGYGFWTIESVAVDEGGTGYTDGSPAIIDLGDFDIEVYAAQAIVRTVREEPTLTLTGSASLTVNMESRGSTPATWQIASVTVNSGGSGYSDGQFLTPALGSGGQPVWPATLRVVTDGNGAISSVEVDNPGIYFRDTGVIDSVELVFDGGGGYYKSSGEITNVTLYSGGSFYREDASLQPYVATPTVVISQTSPSNGAGATFNVTVGSDPNNASTFGKVTAVSIANGGNGYLKWATVKGQCCGQFYNGKTYTLRRGYLRSGEHIPEDKQDEDEIQGRLFPTRCDYFVMPCGVGNATALRGGLKIEYRGPDVRPVVRLFSELDFPGGGYEGSGCDLTFTSTSFVTDCDDFSFAATAPNGGTVTVEAGGEYDEDVDYSGPGSCTGCCKGAEPLPEEIVASWQPDPNFSPLQAPPAGDVVLPLFFSACDGTRWLLMIGGFEIHAVWQTCSLRDSDPDGDFGPRIRVSGVEYLPSCSAGHVPMTYIGIGNQQQQFPGITDVSPPCDDCHEKCYFYIQLGYVVGGFALRFASTSVDSYQGNSFACGDCVETPVCSPPPAAYTLRHRVNPRPLIGTLTIV